NRVFAILLETKNFNGNLTINKFGEFTVQYPSGKKKGIPSPIEQSKRHERILLKLFDRIGVKMKTGRPLEVHHAVLVSPQSIIRRPDSKDFDTSCVIKADAIRQWHEQFGENRVGVGFVLNHMFDALLINNETIHEWGRRIAAEHKPEGLLEYLPNSIKPLLTNCHTCGQAISENEALLCLHNHERFNGKIYCREHQQAALQQKASPASPESETEHDEYCEHSGCHEKLSQAVIQYCQKHSSRFGGKLYCREHQQRNTTNKISNAQAEQTETEQIHCSHPGCDKKLTPAVIQYCQKYSKRFHGKLYCMEHQRAPNRA
ncbi:MAG: nuclease-related domain-containing protein, partial [Eikenella corrodens]